MTSAMNWLATWASSPGGPDRNLQEHRGDRSTLGTERNTVAVNQISPLVYFFFWFTFKGVIHCKGKRKALYNTSVTFFSIFNENLRLR